MFVFSGRGALSRRVRALVAGASILLLALPAAGAEPANAQPQAVMAVPADQAATSAVALAADPAGFDHAFYRGQDGAVYVRTFRDGVWSTQTNLGGKIVGAPAAARAGATLAVAARGTDGVLWLKTNTQGTWGPWQGLGGVLAAAPAVIGDPAGGMTVFVRGTDNRLYTKARGAGGTWSAWSSVGSGVASGPAALSTGEGGAEVYVTRADHTVWWASRTTAGWSAWQPLGGVTHTAVAATWDAQTETTWVFARGTNNVLYVKQRRAGAWTGWQSIGTTLIDAPAVVAAAGGGIDVVVRGTDNALWSRWQRNGAWSAWSRAWVPAAPSAPPSSRLGVDWTRIPTSSRLVGLTFDAGANADAIPSILATLRTKNVPATFFLTGQWVRNFPAQANDVAVSGFVVGNHTDTHPELTTLSDAQVRAELSSAQRSILLANGAETRPLFRFPFGDVDSRVLGIANGMGYVGVRWTVDSLGWQGTSGGMTAQKVFDRVMAGLQPGEIVLMHVGSHPTDKSMLDAAALPRIIDAMRARGYTFVTMSALTG
ncbi:MAG TPA: polysaccharide deacetylase family protein [Acidimicrobiales bacterium]|nr:polysaccharide deacetylase family protein [Acidimicrobiales bacterium]